MICVDAADSNRQLTPFVHSGGGRSIARGWRREKRNVEEWEHTDRSETRVSLRLSLVESVVIVPETECRDLYTHSDKVLESGRERERKKGGRERDGNMSL